MKEFEKKGNPNREPPSEGMKGLSKFLPMTDSNYRRRLTEYEVQVQDLQSYVRSLEAETGRLRKKLEDAPKEFMVLETSSARPTGSSCRPSIRTRSSSIRSTRRASRSHRSKKRWTSCARRLRRTACISRSTRTARSTSCPRAGR